MKLRAAAAVVIAFLPLSLPSAQPRSRSICRTPTAAEPCPLVHTVHRQSAPGPALNLLILGDGFREAELDQYRCAVARMVARLLTMPPYRTYACSMNIYRIDLITGRAVSGIGVEPGCSDEDGCEAKPPAPYSAWACPAPLPTFVAGPSLELEIAAPACAILDLETRLCFGGKSCRLIGPSLAGLQRIDQISTCVPDLDAVMILAHSGRYSGRAKVENNPPYAVATLWSVASDAPWNLQAHELGHALFGLLDEYTTDPPCGSGCGYRWSKNVVSGREVLAGVQFPWQSECPAGDCGSFCTYVTYPSSQSCAPGTSCPTGQGGNPCCPPTWAVNPPSYFRLSNFVGLVEGGWYRRCGFYRAEGRCKMNTILRHPFCTGCAAAARVQLDALGIQPCSIRPVTTVPTP